MNPRKNDEAVQYVADSLKEFGQMRPIGVDENLEIIYGHTTLKAAKKLKLTEVKICIHSGLSDIHKRAYRIADNKLQERAYWDYGKLESEMKKIVGKMNTAFIINDDELKEIFNFDIIEDDDLETSSPQGNYYQANALAIKINDILGFVEVKELKAYMDYLSALLLDEFGSDQKLYNAFMENLIPVLKENEKDLIKKSLDRQK